MDSLRDILRRYWGYESFRPLQAEAMQSVLDGRDSVVVMPTGGGKSLCFQAPALTMPGLAIVVSPLISLMKDQVDALTDCGVPAACLNSASPPDERRRIMSEVRQGTLKLLYLAPERLMMDSALEFLGKAKPSFFAIDEAHCISDWGHDFRPEYRALQQLKSHFPDVAIHAYTATATERVRDDISRQLLLDNPSVLVGSFDRPNLTYRVTRRGDLLAQIQEVIARHPKEAGIVYCMRRRDVEEISDALKRAGHEARPYHAGLTDVARRKNQEAFARDRANIIVATVAFGMGIDKSDVRYVIHAAAPKSLEHYQQETGRAGRDGLEAECCLFYSPGDFVTWRRLQQDQPEAAQQASRALLADMERFCATLTCRHRAIVEYFGQTLAKPNCGACDVCAEEVELMSDSLVTAQKILSCVARLKERFGVTYVARVLAGSRDQRVLEQGHDKLSTYGLLSHCNRGDVRIWIEQLVAQEFLRRNGDFDVLELTPSGWQVLKGEVTPQLSRPAGKSKQAKKTTDVSWEGVDHGLFEQLRVWRRDKAADRGVAAFVVASDVTLRDLARRRPAKLQALLEVSGIGEKKAAEYGSELLEQIRQYGDGSA